MSKTTILIETETRDLLKAMGNKGQTYDAVINELIETKRNEDLLDHSVESLLSSKFQRS